LASRGRVTSELWWEIDWADVVNIAMLLSVTSELWWEIDSQS
jgi:hypothetical protein